MFNFLLRGRVELGLNGTIWNNAKPQISGSIDGVLISSAINAEQRPGFIAGASAGICCHPVLAAMAPRIYLSHSLSTGISHAT